MSYGTLAQVYGLCAVILTSGSQQQPSDAQITQFLSDRSNELDAALASRGIVTPITATSPGSAALLAELGYLNAEGAAFDVWLASFITVAGIDAQRTPGNVHKAHYEARLEQIRNGVGIPAGLVYSEGNTAAPRSYGSDNPVTQNGYTYPGDMQSVELDRYGAAGDPGPAFVKGRVW